MCAFSKPNSRVVTYFPHWQLAELLLTRRSAHYVTSYPTHCASFMSRDTLRDPRTYWIHSLNPCSSERGETENKKPCFLLMLCQISEKPGCSRRMEQARCTSSSLACFWAEKRSWKTGNGVATLKWRNVIWQKGDGESKEKERERGRGGEMEHIGSSSGVEEHYGTVVPFG